jgi:ERCC4-type nuclease
MSQEGFDLIVDSREASKQPRLLSSLSQALRVKVDLLPAGDYLLPSPAGRRPLLLERKTPTDLVQGLKGRLWPQLKGLAEAKGEADVAIAIVGYLPVIRKLTRWNESAVARLIEEIVLEWQIPVIPCPDDRWFIGWLVAKARSLGRPEEKRSYPLRHGKRGSSLNERVLFVAAGLAGPQIAMALLRKFGTLRALANAGPEELKIPKLVGEKRAQEIWAVLNTPWNGEEGEAQLK